jgi:2-polyprenyl-3-methyl-5-hydroxy-6-metoxy-1,4-benzoquinol methylase
VKYARDRLGVNAVCADFLEMEDEPGAYDVVCLWDTIEHLTHPVRVVKKAARWLKPGGVMAITTGDVGSGVARLRGARWRQIHPPTHVFYFSRDTLAKTAKAADLEVVEAPHVGYSRNYQSMVHGVFGDTGVVPRTLTLGGKVDFPVYLNLFDIVMLVARKPTVPPAAG